MGLDYIKTPSGILKAAQTLFLMIALSIYSGAPCVFSYTMHADRFGCGVLVTGFIVTPILLGVYLTHESGVRDSLLELVLSFLLFLFLLAAGSVAIDTGVHMVSKGSSNKALGSFCLFASFAYLGDGVLSLMSLRSGGES